MTVAAPRISRAITEWYEPIQNFASLGSKAKNEAKFFE
jgi:hypothetical protein